MSSRVYHDPLHGAIRLDRDEPAEALVMDLIESSPFQRLRRIRQLGPAFLTFHGAESSRFTHSLGVFHLARRALNGLEPHHRDLAEHRSLLFAAALLHDIGHAPLSHSGEEMYGLRHEAWSARLIREHPQLRDRLNSHQSGLAEAVADLLETGRCQCPAIKALVSSQLDCDRLDYLMRDAYSTGMTYGRIDLERILAAFTLTPDRSLAIRPKGLMAVEHYLVVRNLMYRSVYNHRLNVVCNWLLSQVIQLARRLGAGAIPADAVMTAWLWDRSHLDIERFLANDDHRTGYHLMLWREQGPAPLADLCARLLDRRLLKATDVSALDNAQRLSLLATARRLTGSAGLDPDLHCGLRQRQSRGYHPYHGGLRLWDGVHLQALEQHSPLVTSLSLNSEMAWLIHPGDVSEELLRERDLLAPPRLVRPAPQDPA